MQDAHQIPSARICDNRNARGYYPAPVHGTTEVADHDRVGASTELGNLASRQNTHLCETAGGQATSTTVCLVAHDDTASSEDREQLAISPDVAPIIPLGPPGFGGQQKAIGHRMLAHAGCASLSIAMP